MIAWGTAPRCGWAALALLALSSAVQPASAKQMIVMESRPAAQAVMTGPDIQFFVRFDGPVDHAASSLVVVHEGQAVQSLRPRLNSQPNTLYASPRRLSPGAYELRWRTRSMTDHDVSSGSIPFTVR